MEDNVDYNNGNKNMVYYIGECYDTVYYNTLIYKQYSLNILYSDWSN